MTVLITGTPDKLRYLQRIRALSLLKVFPWRTLRAEQVASDSFSGGRSIAVRLGAP